MPYVDAEQALSATADFWTEWNSHARYPAGPYRDAIARSIITLKALTYAPTGAMVAALTRGKVDAESYDREAPARIKAQLY